MPNQVTSDKRPILDVKSISKSFSHVQALSEIDLQVYPGEVVGVVGDNGAGKSTLIGCITGALTPDTGTIRLGDIDITHADPATVRSYGVETVYQTLALAPDLSVSNSLFLGRERFRSGLLGRLGFIDWARTRQESVESLEALGINLPSINVPVSILSGGQRQSLAVARAVKWGQRLIIMDEPTAALGVAQSANVLNTIRRVRELGIPVILISHNLSDVFAVVDRIVVLRLGRVVANLVKTETTLEYVVALITGAISPGSTAPG